jgi:ABC-type lipoprotein export system ATPase subunit
MAAKSSNISEPKSAAINLLESLGIQHIADRKPANLSGGEARRLAFARVLICSPELILLDEAFSSLDSKSRMQGIKLLKAVLELTSAAVIMVTHNKDDAQQLDFPIYDMVGGHLIAR